MKTRLKINTIVTRLMAGGLFFVCLAVPAQNYSIGWYKVSSGGGTSANGPFSVASAIGQPDAGGVMSGGNYSVAGGFWSLVSVVQMPGAPNLFIVSTSPNSLKILWPDAATNRYTLQENPNLSNSSGWVPSGLPITSAAGTNSVNITAPVGNLFFRLKQ